MASLTPCRPHRTAHGVQCRAGAKSISAQALSRRQAALDLAAAVVGQSLLPRDGAAAGLPALFGMDVPAAEPALIPRKSLQQNFAVLLLRSVYEAADSMDFMPMDEYQMRFFKLRRDAWPNYLSACKPVSVRQVWGPSLDATTSFCAEQQGDLQDPLYFDFISWAQSATLSQQMPVGKQTFQEYCEECEDTGRLRTVNRSAELASNAVLPAALQQRAGDMIYAGMRESFRGDTYDVPAPCPAGASLSELVGCVQQLVDVFVAKGYAIKGKVSAVEPHRGEHGVEWHGAGAGGGTFRVQLQSPANLYGLARLAQEGGVATAFDALTIGALLRASGCDASFKVHRNGNTITSDWSVLA